MEQAWQGHGAKSRQPRTEKFPSPQRTAATQARSPLDRSHASSMSPSAADDKSMLARRRRKKLGQQPAARKAPRCRGPRTRLYAVLYIAKPNFPKTAKSQKN